MFEVSVWIPNTKKNLIILSEYNYLWFLCLSFYVSCNPFKDVRIFVLGEAKIKWCEHAGRHTTYYKSHETYIDNGSNTRIENVLQPGTYTYPFDIALPPLCPTSCECKYGYIRYILSLKLKGPFGLDNFVFKKPLTVLQKVDLNLYPEYKVSNYL